MLCIHLGAGDQLPGNALSHKYKALAKKALKLGRRMLDDNQSAANVVVEVCKLLEDSDLTNAGAGSELTSAGTVEMDATITDGINFASVGAITEVRNPIEVVAQLYNDLCSEQVDMFGRSKPHFFGGSQISKNKKLMKNVTLAGNQSLVTEAAYKRFLYWDQIYKGLSAESVGFEKTVSVTDTIGVICYDFNGRICAGSSSGGITYKDPGRIGPAAIHGAATHIQSRIGCCTSGYGEDITQLSLASRITEALRIHQQNEPEESNLEVIQDLIVRLNDEGQHQSKPLAIGGLAVSYESQSIIRLALFHTTPSFIAGYTCGDDEKVLVSKVTEKSGYFQGMEIKLRQKSST